MNPTSIAFGVLVLLAGAALDAGVIIAARQARFPRERWTRLAITLTAGLDAWLALTFLLAWAGFFRAFDRLPPRIPVVVLACITTIVLLSRTKGFREIARACPPSYPIALQTFRVFVELVLWQLYREGRVPVQMTFEGWNFDILVGLSAPAVAWAAARGALGRRALVGWNVVSLGLLANIVIIANRAAPGPLHAAWGNPSSTVIAEAPYIWLPAFLVPLAVLLHVVSLRQVGGAEAAAVATLGRAEGDAAAGAASRDSSWASTEK